MELSQSQTQSKYPTNKLSCPQLVNQAYQDSHLWAHFILKKTKFFSGLKNRPRLASPLQLVSEAKSRQKLSVLGELV